MNFFEPFRLQKRLRSEQEPRAIEHQLRTVLDRMGFTVSQLPAGGLVGRKGSKLRTWLVGARRTQPERLPVRVDIHGARSPSGTTVAIEIADDWGFGLRTGAESAFLPHLNRILSEVTAKASLTDATPDAQSLVRQADPRPASERRRAYVALGLFVFIVVSSLFVIETLLRFATGLFR